MATATNNHHQSNYKPIPLARKAEKRQVKLKLCIQGPSGSCKTKGALQLATQLWPDSKILLVDTENESASLYADDFDFDTIPLDPPFESSRYEACIDYAVRSGYDVLILDTITHQWDGEGGILRRKEELDRRPGSNSFTNWATFTPEHTHFIEAIKQAPIHVIATMRSKQEYALEQNDKGKSKPVKLGMAPIQRDGMDYEFTIVFDGQMDHRCTISKDRTSLFDDRPVNLADAKVAAKIKAWLENGKPADTQTAPKVAPQTPQAAPVVTPKPAAAPPSQSQKVEGWKLDGDHLHCHVYDILKKTSKKNEPFLAVKYNAIVNGKDIAFCFNALLFDAVLATKGKSCVFFVSPANYTGIEDVVKVGDVEYANGQPKAPPVENIHGVDITDSDIPF